MRRNIVPESNKKYFLRRLPTDDINFSKSVLRQQSFASERGALSLDCLSGNQHRGLPLPCAGGGSNRGGNGRPMDAGVAGRSVLLLFFRIGAENLPGNIVENKSVMTFTKSRVMLKLKRT